MTNQGFQQLSDSDKKKLKGQVLFLSGNDLEKAYQRGASHVRRTQRSKRTSRRSSGEIG